MSLSPRLYRVSNQERGDVSPRGCQLRGVQVASLFDKAFLLYAADPNADRQLLALCGASPSVGRLARFLLAASLEFVQTH